MPGKIEVGQVYERGQIVIPKSFRDEMNIEAGNKLMAIEVDKNNILLKKMEAPKLEDWKKMLEPIQKKMQKMDLKEADSDKWVEDYRKKK